jgi:hypothetical protein
MPDCPKCAAKDEIITCLRNYAEALKRERDQFRDFRDQVLHHLHTDGLRVDWGEATPDPERTP